MLNKVLKDIVSDKKPVVLYFYSKKYLNTLDSLKTLEELQEKHEDVIIIHKINIDDNKKIIKDFAILSIPLIICYKNKKEVYRFTGSQTRRQIETIIYMTINN